VLVEEEAVIEQEELVLREPEQLVGGGSLYLNHHCEFLWGVCGTMDTVAPVPNQQHERTIARLFYQPRRRASGMLYGSRRIVHLPLPLDRGNIFGGGKLLFN
jgi:hypothetical protein